MSQRPDDHRNLLIAVALSMAVMLGWQVFYAGPQIKEQQERAQRERTAQQQEAGKAAGESPAETPAAPGTALPGSRPAAQPTIAGLPVATRAEALTRSARVPIETPSLTGSISLKGGLIDDLVLLNYRETVDPKSPNVVLFSPLGAPGAYFAEYGWQGAVGAQVPLPDSETVWQAESGAKLTPDTPVTLTWDNGQGLTFRRTISIDEHYMLKVSDQVQNATSGDVVLTPYARLYRFGTPLSMGFGTILHEGLIGVPGDAGLQEIPYSDVLEDGGTKSFDGKTGGWLGITDKYWAATLIPDQKATYAASFRGQRSAAASQEVYWTDYQLGVQPIAAGATHTVEGHLYAGAKQVKLVEGYEQALGIEKFELLIDWGWFYFITKPLYYVIDWLYGILGNFGLAILAVTVIVKLLFFPLANKSYESMAKMKKLQPQMEQLRERYKDDKAKQQQELMALYQKEKINPLAGCLPILVQIPVFFALYKVLFVSIDMRHAPFFGWIRDLSAADPTSIFNLFGLLPFAVPEFLQIGVWPVIMGLTMWVQMQLNPPQPDPIQQKLFSYMPLLFTFLLASFPAGLVIYWAWNNILSIAQQWYISQKQGAEIHLIDNLKRTFAPLGRLVGLKTESKSETKG